MLLIKSMWELTLESNEIENSHINMVEMVLIILFIVFVYCFSTIMVLKVIHNRF